MTKPPTHFMQNKAASALRQSKTPLAPIACSGAISRSSVRGKPSTQAASFSVSEMLYREYLKSAFSSVLQVSWSSGSLQACRKAYTVAIISKWWHQPT